MADNSKKRCDRPRGSGCMAHRAAYSRLYGPYMRAAGLGG
jgi:hypothetical protein